MTTKKGFEQRYCSSSQLRRCNSNHLCLQFGIGIVKGERPCAVVRGLIFTKSDRNARTPLRARLGRWGLPKRGIKSISRFFKLLFALKSERAAFKLRYTNCIRFAFNHAA